MPNFSVNYEMAYRVALDAFKKIDPAIAAGNTDVVYHAIDRENGRFHIVFLRHNYTVDFPEGNILEARSNTEPPLLTKLLIIRYLSNGDGTALTGEWINFRQLPSGLMYQSAFLAQTLQPIAQVYGRDVDGFIAAAEEAGGEPARLGDASFLFRVFPRVPILVVLWAGDDELPASVDMLFDSSIPNYLSLEDVDAVGRHLKTLLLSK